MRSRPTSQQAATDTTDKTASRPASTGRGGTGGHGGGGPGGRGAGRPRRPGSAAARPARSNKPGTMRHKGYTAKVGYDDDAGVLRGEVVDLQDEIRFSATSVRQLRQEFHAAVDAYLLDCATRGVEPAKPFSGRILLRLPPELHRAAATTASAMEVRLNDLLVG